MRGMIIPVTIEMDSYVKNTVSLKDFLSQYYRVTAHILVNSVQSRILYCKAGKYSTRDNSQYIHAITLLLYDKTIKMLKTSIFNISNITFPEQYCTE